MSRNVSFSNKPISPTLSRVRCHKYIISLHHYFVTLSIYKKMIKISRAMSFVSIDEKILEKGSVSNEKQSRLLRHSREHR